MQKGKYGICLWFYAVLGFVLAILNQVLLCGLLLAFVAAAEKNEWAAKQVMQAFFLSLINSIVSAITGALFGSAVAISFFSWGTSALASVFSFIAGIISLVILIFSIIGIVNTAKGRDANIPGLQALANRAYGYVAPKVYPNYPPQGGYQQPQNPGYQAPQNPNYQPPQQGGNTQPPQNGGAQPPQQ